MSDIAIDENGDLDFKNGDLYLVTGLDGIRQNLKQRLHSFKNEWFLDLSDGLPYYESILVKNPNAQVVEGLFLDCILATKGVLEIENFRFDYDPKSRSLNISFIAKCADGEIDYSDTL